MKSMMTLKGKINELGESVLMAFAAIRGLDKYLFTLEALLVKKGILTKEELDEIRTGALSPDDEPKEESRIITP